MNQRRLVGAAGLLLVLLCFTPSPVLSQHSTYSPKAETSQTAAKAEEKSKEEEARKEAEKRAEAEEQKKQEADSAAGAKEDEKDQEVKDQASEESASKQEEDKAKEDEAKKEEEKAKEEASQKEEDKPKEEASQTENNTDDQARLEEERRLEEEARLEVEKREELEREKEHERHHHHYPDDTGVYYPDDSNDDEVIIVIPPKPDDTTTTPTGTGTPGTTSPDGAVIPTSAPGPRSPYSGYYPQVPDNKPHASLLFAPGSGDRKSAVGIQYLTKKNYGVGLWFSGDFGGDDDVIETTIPHNDYYTESKTGTYGVEALYAVGSDKAALIIGAGVSVEQTTYTDISNATGWKWDGGSSKEVKPAAQIGCRFQVGGRASLQIGYDTVQATYFGLSASF